MAKTHSTFSDSLSLAEHFRRPVLLLSVLGALTFIVYMVSLSFEFVWDDTFQIVDNPIIRSWSNLSEVFMKDLWFHVHHGQLYYRPLFTTWSVFNYAVFQLNPWGWHLTAILLHIVTVCSVYVLARKLRLEYWTSALAAALFAFHPIHIETISWISAASDTMVTLFYVLAFVAFLKTRESSLHRARWQVVSILLLALALLTKEMGVTFAGLVAVYVWLFPSTEGVTSFQRRLREASLAAVPYIVTTLGYLVLRKYALHALVAPIEVHRTLAQYVTTVLYVLAFYLRLLVFPTNLTALYDTPFLKRDQVMIFVLSVVALVAYAGLLWLWQKRKQDRMVVFLGLWPLLCLIPSLFVPYFVAGDFVRDRYAYLPSVGFILLGAKAIRLLPGLGKIRAEALQVAVSVIIVLAYIAGCSQQIYWANELSVFRRGHELYPKHLFATVGYARLLQRTGQPEEAIALLEQVVAEDPKNIGAYWQLAEAYPRVGNLQKGRDAMARGLELASQYRIGDAETADVAGLLGRLGNYDAALRLCTAVLQSEPDLLSALYNCGNINFQVGRYADAEELLSRALQLDPGYADSSYWLGRVYFQTGRLPKAEAAFRKALALRPDSYDYHYRLAETLEAAGDLNNARLQYQEVLQLSPNDPQAKRRLADLDHSSFAK